MDDERFRNIATDPRFRPLPSRFRKVKIDDRFKGMFTEKKFKVKCSVDERGRPVKLSSNKHLKKFYELSSSEEEVSDEDEEENEKSDSAAEVEQEETTPVEKEKTVSQKASKERKRKKKRAEDKSVQESEDEDEDESAVVKRKEITPMEDFARGIAMMSSSSSEDEDDDEFAVPYDQEAHDDHYWGEHDRDAESTEEITNRLAIQNMDWDRIKAYDLFMLLNSFKPSSGTVRNVKIYPSEYGKEKMAQDDLSGPKELRNAKLNKDGEADGKLKSLSEKDQKRAMLENLRQYQLNRLKYYYAVAEFDSAETANYIYTNCDGREYLASCTQLDLRFIPEDMEFDDNEVKDSANHVPDNYEPRFFINPALGQSLVKCTWDENAPDRYDMLNKKYKPGDLEQADIDNYLASESDEEEEAETTSTKKVKSKRTKSEGPEASLPLVASDDSDGSEEADEKSIAKYRALLLGGTDNSKDEQNSESDDAVDMEITWDTGLKDTAEDMVKKSKSKKVKDGELSVFERKREEKREKAKLAKKAQKQLDRQTKKAAKSSSKSAKFDLEEEDSLGEQAFSDDDIPDGFDQGSDLEPEEALGKKGKKNKKWSKKTKTDVSKAEDEEDAGLDLMLMAGTDGSKAKKHFNIKEIAEYDNMTKSKRKRKLKKKQLKEIEDDFQINVKDERFSALYSSHLYNIDPSSQVYRKTKAMDAIVEEKQRRIRENERTIDKPKKRKIDTNGLASDSNKQTKLSSNNMSSLVKSVKAKTKLHTGKHGAKS